MNSLVLRNIAVLLDVDGTILNIAPSPDRVHAPTSLKHSLARILALAGGAMALVSGRKITDLDRILAPLRLPAIGGHGAEIRRTSHAKIVTRQAAALDPGLKQKLAAIAQNKPGVMVEDKGFSLALHFRKVPDQARAVREAAVAICDSYPPGTIELLPGKAVIEIKRPDFSKGDAVRKLMRLPPFRSRRPIFIGDDITDESVFAMLHEFKGFGFSVGRRFPGVAGHFGMPADVRRWLFRIAETRSIPEP